MSSMLFGISDQEMHRKRSGGWPPKDGVLGLDVVWWFQPFITAMHWTLLPTLSLLVGTHPRFLVARCLFHGACTVQQLQANIRHWSVPVVGNLQLCSTHRSFQTRLCVFLCFQIIYRKDQTPPYYPAVKEHCAPKPTQPFFCSIMASDRPIAGALCQVQPNRWAAPGNCQPEGKPDPVEPGEEPATGTRDDAVGCVRVCRGFGGLWQWGSGSGKVGVGVLQVFDSGYMVTLSLWVAELANCSSDPKPLAT